MFAFRIFIEKGTKFLIFLLSNLGCDGVTASTCHPLPFIEKYKVLKNLIQDDLVAPTWLVSEVL